jgi:hypothetical protein
MGTLPIGGESDSMPSGSGRKLGWPASCGLGELRTVFRANLRDFGQANTSLESNFSIGFARIEKRDN